MIGVSHWTIADCSDQKRVTLTDFGHFVVSLNKRLPVRCASFSFRRIE